MIYLWLWIVLIKITREILAQSLLSVGSKIICLRGDDNCCDKCVYYQIIMMCVKYKNLITYPVCYLFIDLNMALSMIN